MYTLRKNRKGEGGSVHPLFLHCPPISLSLSLFNKQDYWSFFYKKTQRNKANVSSSETILCVYILQLARIFTNHTKGTTIKAVSPVSATTVQTRHCSPTSQLNTRAKRRMNWVLWESGSGQPARSNNPAFTESPSRPDADEQELEIDSWHLDVSWKQIFFGGVGLEPTSVQFQRSSWSYWTLYL